ncbi:SRPBCC family protein [Actinomadura napierensis]
MTGAPMPFEQPIATGRITVNASPAAVYRIVSDPTVMITFAEEAYRARWLGRTTRAAVGARFRGYNRKGRRRWFTNCTVTDVRENERFAYDVDTPFGLPISRWQYDITPAEDGGGCTVTETNWLRVPPWFIPLAIALTGTADRPAHNTRNIATTLGRLKAHLEATHEDQPST